MRSNSSTFIYFALLIALIGGSIYVRDYSKYKRSVKILVDESENAREVYTGKIKPVYDPIDQAFKIKEFIKTPSDKHIKLGRFNVWPILSIWVDPDDLYSSKRGIVHPDNTFKKGRLWERAAFLRYFKNNQPIFTSYVGLRQHGNGSRKVKVNQKNFRVYFRGKYGEKSFSVEPTLTYKEGSLLKRLVIRKESGINFRNDFYSYLLNRLGGIASKFTHVAFYLNGEFYGHYTMTEHLSFDQFKHSVGHDNFIFAKLRGDMTSRDHMLLDRLRFKLEKYPDEEFDFSFVDQRVDLNSIVGNVLMVMYGGNGDWLQGMYLKDLESNGKWKYIAWDFDTTFSQNYFNRSSKGKEDFLAKSVELVTRKKKGKIPWSVFNRLIYKDKEFREYFSSKVDQLNKILNDSDTIEKLDMYEKLAKDSDSPEVMLKNLEALRLFIVKRKGVFCKDLKAHLNLVPNSCN